MKLLILAIIGAIIGYITNVVAIRLLFRPIKPTKLFKIQGVIPKRKKEIAKNIGKTVNDELVNMEDIIDGFIENMDKEKIKKLAGEKIKNAIIDKIPAFIPSKVVTGYIDQFIIEKGDDFLNDITENIIHKATLNVKIDEMVEKQILDYDLNKIEKIILSLAKTELRHIEILGGVLGFLIGIIQGLIVLNI